MKPTWLIQSVSSYSPIQAEILQSLVDCCEENDFPLIECSILPFSDHIMTFIPIIPESLIIPYGSTSLMKNLIPYKLKGMFFDETLFKPSVWKEHRTDMLNQDLVVCPFNVLGQYMEPDRDYFIKPNGDFKDFNGEVTNAQQFATWYDKVLGIRDEKGSFLMTECVISPFRRIEAEFRCFIVGGKIVDVSMYRRNGVLFKMHIEDDTTLSILQKLADQWLPSMCVCMDVAETSEGYKVIEFNCINGSGFYDSNVKKIVTELTRYVELYQ